MYTCCWYYKSISETSVSQIRCMLMIMNCWPATLHVVSLWNNSLKEYGWFIVYTYFLFPALWPIVCIFLLWTNWYILGSVRTLCTPLFVIFARGLVSCQQFPPNRHKWTNNHTCCTHHSHQKFTPVSRFSSPSSRSDSGTWPPRRTTRRYSLSAWW